MWCGEEKFSNAVKSNLTKTYYIIRSAWKTFQFLSKIFFHKFYVCCVRAGERARSSLISIRLFSSISFSAWYLLISKNVAACCLACSFCRAKTEIRIAASMALQNHFVITFFYGFLIFSFDFVLQNSLTIANDPGTSDDSGRASERLTTSSVAPRDADSSRDRLSDVSIAFHFISLFDAKRFEVTLIAIGDKRFVDAPIAWRNQWKFHSFQHSLRCYFEFNKTKS